MTIRCKCEHCGVSLKVKDELAGKQKRCPQCQEMISIPALATDIQRSRGEEEFSQRVGKDRKPIQPRGGSPEDDFPYFDDIPVRPMGGVNPPLSKSSPLDGGGGDYEPFEDRPGSRKENASSGSAAGIAGDLLRKIESSDRKSRGSGAANKNKKRRIFGDVEDQMSTSERSTLESLKLLVQGFLLPLVGLCALVFGAFYASNYFMGPSLKLPPLGRVYGTINIDGRPVRNARIEFHPLDSEKPVGGENLATSMAISDGNGNFEMYYGANIRGAVVGQHLIMISAQDQQGHELVPPNWNSATEQKFEVKSGSNKVNLEIQTAGLGGPADPGTELGSGEVSNPEGGEVVPVAPGEQGDPIPQ